MGVVNNDSVVRNRALLTRVKQLVAAGSVAAIGVVVAPAAVSADVALSEGCNYLNLDGLDEFYNIGVIFPGQLDFNANEKIRVRATDAPGGSRVALSAYDGPSSGVGGLLLEVSTPVGGDPTEELSVTIPYAAPGWWINWTVLGGQTTVLWEVSCELAPPPISDSDGDGVDDVDDECAGTVATAGGSKKNRYDADASGAFTDSVGRDSGYTIVDTRGCSAAEIAAALGLGPSHSQLGVTASVLATWVG